jgi:hypothetical protein
MTFYKVVTITENPDVFVSFLPNINEAFKLIYEKGKVTRAKKWSMGIFFFGELMEAIEVVAKQPEKRKIFVCRPIGKVKKVEQGLSWEGMTDWITSFIHYINSKKNKSYFMLKWRSCYTAPAIELLEEVKCEF